MDIRELRIGNYALYEDRVLVCESLTAKDSYDGVVRSEWINDDFHLLCEDFQDINPIPLTKDILLRCGFDIMSNGDGYYLELNVPNTSVTLNCTNLRLAVEIECVEIMEQPKYLHQLQNLYFALCGEELNVEL